MRKCVFFLSLILVVLGGSAVRVNAQPDKKTSPRQAFEKSDAVFSGKIIAVAPGKQRLRNITSNYTSVFDDSELQTARVKIEKMFRRADFFGLTEGETLVIYPPERCQINFKKNENWLFYARYDEETYSWVISDCYRTQLLTDAPDDLKFFENLSGALQRSRVSGRVVQMIVPPTKTEKGIYKPVAGVEMVAKIENYNVSPPTKQEFFAKTDANGVYEIYDLPDGFPSISLKTQDNSKLYKTEDFGEPYDYARKEKTSRGVDFYFSLGFAIIKGKVTDDGGKPLSGIKVRLIPTEKDAEDLYSEITSTNSDGNYEIKFAAEKIRGKYIVAANDEIYREPKPPYSAAYFPQGNDRKTARLIEPKDGQTLENIDINLGAKLNEKSVSGKVSFNDGSEVPSGKVVFDGKMNIEYLYNSDFERKFVFPDNADVLNGDFTLKALEKRSGKLHAELLFKRDVLESCLKRKLNLPAKEDYVLVASKPVYLTIGKTTNNLSLKFAIPPCRALSEAESDAYWARKATYLDRYGYTRYGKKVTSPNFATDEERTAYFLENEYKEEILPADYDSYLPENMLAQTQVVFLGAIVRSLDEASDTEKKAFQLAPYFFDKAFFVKVEKIFKGGEIYGIETGDTILIGEVNYLNPKLERGNKYLFFLRRWDSFDSLWRVTNSDTTKPIEQAQNYLRAYESPVKTGRRRISGYLKLEKDRDRRISSSAPQFSRSELLGGVNVILMAKDPTPENLKNFPASRYFKTVTDANGFYEFDDLAPGNYWVLPSAPKYRYRYGSQVFGKVTAEESRIGSLVDLNLQDKAGVDFYIYERGEIHGKVLDEKGNAVGQAMVRLLDAETRKPVDFAAERFTTPNGEFGFGRIPEGKYLLTVSSSPPINFRANFKTIYYPNASLPEKAVAIEIVRGAKKENVNLTVSDLLPEKTAAGTIIFPNNIAAKNDVFLTFDGAWEYILLKNDYHEFFTDLRTKPFETKIENGKFSVSIPEGASGKMQAFVLVKAEKAAECLQTEFLPKADEKGFVKIYSKAIDLTIDQTGKNLKLSFIAPESCFEK